MAVNNNFYATINALVKQATGQTTTVVADYGSFIDAGKKITDLAYTDLQNNFISALMNMIAEIVNTARSYTGAYKELIRGKLEFGNTVEVIINKFYEAQAAPFVALVDGESVDQYVINKPKVDVNYYTKTNAYTIPITIQYDQLKKAWSNPGEMDAFINGVTMYVLNSDEFNREVGRIGLVADLIVKDLGETAATTIDTPAQVYKLLSLYEDVSGVELTADEALYNEEFVKFAVKTINMVARKMERPSSSFNSDGIVTFTPSNARNLFVLSPLTSALGAYVFPPSYQQTEEITLSGAIDVPYWQDESHPYTITYATGETETPSATTDPVIAVIADSYAIGEWERKRDMRMSPFNARGEYWNNFLNVEVMDVSVSSANSVVFALA